MLTIEDLHAGYEKTEVLHGVSKRLELGLQLLLELEAGVIRGDEDGFVSHVVILDDAWSRRPKQRARRI